MTTIPRIDHPHLTPAVSERDHAQGPATAPVTLVEYGDYECPSCRAAVPVVTELRQRLGDRLRFVFRNYPLLQSHPHALHAAEAAEAAGAQGEAQFWAMHDHLYAHQDALDDTSLIDYAAALGLSAGRFVAEMSGHAHMARIGEDARGGDASGVQGTPTFFVNGARHDGPADVATLLRVIEGAATRA